jgi:hypothetical protein
LGQEERGTRWRINFMAVVHFDNFDVPIVTEARRGLFDQGAEQIDPERRIGRLNDWHILSGIIDHRLMRCVEPGGADEDRGFGKARGSEVRGKRVRGRKVDDDIADFGERRCIAADIDAGMGATRIFDCCCNGLAHASRAAEDCDSCFALRHDFTL